MSALGESCIYHEQTERCKTSGVQLLNTPSLSCTALSNHARTNISIQISLRQISCESFYDTLVKLVIARAGAEVETSVLNAYGPNHPRPPINFNCTTSIILGKFYVTVSIIEYCGRDQEAPYMGLRPWRIKQ